MKVYKISWESAEEVGQSWCSSEVKAKKVKHGFQKEGLASEITIEEIPTKKDLFIEWLNLYCI